MAKFKDLYPQRATALRDSSIRYQEFKNLLMNNITIDELPFPVEARVKSVLIECGQVGYDKISDKWAAVFGEGVNDLGNPIWGTFVFPNRASFQRKLSYEPDESGAYIITAFESPFAVGEMIRYTCEILDACDVGIYQNLKACQTPLIVTCKDEDIRLSIEHAVQQKEQGAPAIVVASGIGEAIAGVDLKTQFIADKYAQYRDMERDRLLNKLGTMTANINKRERVQVGEVNATVGQCVDYLYMMIDTFNKQMDTYGLPFKMRVNGSLEELYGADSPEESEDDENV